MAHLLGYLILALFSTFASAQTTYMSVVTQWGGQGYTRSTLSDCQSTGLANWLAVNPSRTCSGSWGNRYWTGTAWRYSYDLAQNCTQGGQPVTGYLHCTANINTCPYGGTYNSSTGYCTGAPACPTGQERNVSTGQCQPIPNQCTGTGQYQFSDGSCGCKLGYNQQPDGSCVSDCPNRTSETVTLFSDDRASAGCSGGCLYTRAAVPGGSSCSLNLDLSDDGGAAFSCQYRATGANCTGTPESPPDPETPPPEPDIPPDQEDPVPLPPAPCPTGSSGGTINGVDVCLPAPITDREGTVTRIDENPDGSTTETVTTIRDRINDDGTVSREIVRTITNRDSSGNVTGTTTERRTEDGSKSGFCEENPNATICGDGNGYGATCGSDFSCSGDAVQCGIAYESHITACAVVADDSVLGEFDTIRDFDGTGDGEGLDRRIIEVDQLDVSLSGGGAGLSDLSFTVAGVTVEIPFSRLNQYLAMIGYAMLAIAWLIAFRIISGAF